MTRTVVALAPGDGATHAAAVLVHHRIASAPVVDATGALVGVVSEADQLRGRSGQDPRAHLRTELLPGAPGRGLVADVMTRGAVTAAPTTDTADAARTLLDLGLSAMPVVERGRVVGVIARRDLLRTLTRPDADVRADVEALLAGPSAAEVGLAGTGAWRVEVLDGVVHLHGGPGPAGRAAQHRLAAVLARGVAGAVDVADHPGPPAPVPSPRDPGTA